MSAYVEPKPIDGYVEQAINRFIEDFRDKKVIRGVAESWIETTERVELVLFDMLAALNLETSTNSAGLAILGSYVGEARNGKSLEQFRQSIKVRVRINRSRGLHEDLIDVSRLLTPTYDIRDYYPAAAIVRVGDDVDPVFFADAMRRTKAHGVQLHSVFSVAGHARTMRYGSALHSSDGNGYGTVVHVNPIRALAHVRIK